MTWTYGNILCNSPESISAIRSYLIPYTVWLRNMSICQIWKLCHSDVDGGRGRGGRSFQQMESTLTLGAGQRARHSVRQDLCVHLWICLLLWVKLVWCHICTCIKVFPAEDQSSHWFVTSFNPRPSKANKESVFRIRSPHKSLPWHAPWWSGKRRWTESALFKVCQEQEEAHLWVR